MESKTMTKVLVVTVVMQALTLLAVWTAGPSLLPQAQAQVIDSGAQRQQMISELKTVSGKLDRLIGLLESGNVQVKVDLPDDGE